MPDLDATAKEANVRDSIKKYFVDSLHTGESVHLSFDKYLSTPDIRSKSVDRWVTVNFGEMHMDVMGSHMLNIFCCTRSDGEGFKLAQLRDKVYKYLVDNTKTDGMARIPFYRSRADGNWTLLGGGFIVRSVIESQQFEADDGTKYKVLTANLRFSSKV